MPLEKHHKIGIGIFLFVKILLIISIVWLSITLITVRTELQLQINSLEENLNEKITSNQQTVQSQINEISNNLEMTQEDLSEQFNELKAKTDDDFSGIIDDVTPGVVNVRTDISQGSGFIISDDSYVITNAHVLSGGRYAEVLTYESSRWIDADLIGYNADMDIAILQIPPSSDYLEFANSDNLKVGQKTIAIGNPLGLSFTVTQGIISALDRIGPNGIEAYIQIDTPLNPGNSGGPLINTEGEVIGINNFKVSSGESLGFALESNYLEDIVNDISKQKLNQSLI